MATACSTAGLTRDVHEVCETKSAAVDHPNAKSTFAAAGGHGDFSSFDVELLPVGLETHQVPLLNTAGSASIGDDVGTGQQTIFRTVRQHLIPPTLR